jgi:hypothetical protein
MYLAHCINWRVTKTAKLPLLKAEVSRARRLGEGKVKEGILWLSNREVVIRKVIWQMCRGSCHALDGREYVRQL